MLRISLIVLNLLGAALSIALLVATFFSTRMITAKVREIAIERARSHADPLVAKFDGALVHPVTGRLIQGPTRERLEAEVQAYRSSPEAWLEQLAKQGAGSANRFVFPEVKQPLARKALDLLERELSEMKDNVKASYGKVLADVRLFAGTNLVVFALIAWMCRIARTPRAKHWLLGISLMMMTALAVSASIYVGQNWAWTIIRNDYMGWQYPMLWGVLTGYMLHKVVPDLTATEPSPDPQTP